MASNHASLPNISRAMYKFIEDVEPLEGYTAGGYCPVQIGDHFCSSRYHIVHKLGHGASSTTWLALDKRLSKYVAIKIAVSDLSRSVERDILRSIRDGKACGEKAAVRVFMIPEVLDEFEVEGPQIKGVSKRHHCLVTTPARMSLSEARDASSDLLFQPEVAHAIAFQLIQAVAFLHSRGIVHADLHESNILLRLPNSIDNLNPDQLYQKYGKPRLEKVKRNDGKPLDAWVPVHGVVPIWFGFDSTLSLSDSRILLNDFGESSQPTVEVKYSHTPLIYRAPEMLLEPKSPVPFPAEIWSLASAIFYIMGQRPVFESWFPEEDAILAEHVDALGRLPEEWWEKWESRKDYFDDELRVMPSGSPRRLLEERLEYSVQEPRRENGVTEMSEEEKQDFLGLMRSMLAFKPRDRVSAEQVIGSRWVQIWAMPAMSELMKENSVA